MIDFNFLNVIPANILANNSYLAHVVKTKFGRSDGNEQFEVLYKTRWSAWKYMDTIDLLLAADNNRLEKINYNNSTVAEMYQDVLDRIQPYYLPDFD